MVEKITLDNGVRIIYEHLPHLRSAALGIWVESGSRHEPEDKNGISHFIEHMLFKGTEGRNTTELAEEFDAIGGQVNAFTTKENTCYYCRTLDEYLPRAIDLLCDMYFNSVFPEQETELERGVIVEEIGMYEDNPEDLCNEELFRAVYKGDSLGRPILGTRESLKGIDHQTLKAYHRENYASTGTVVSLCGSYSPRNLDDIVRRFSSLEKREKPARREAEYRTISTCRKKEIEQNHLIVAFPGIALGSDERFAMQIMTNILGGGMSSRLFQKVREKNGLCYTIYTFSSSYFGTGVTGIYTALNKETERKALNLIREELDLFLNEGANEDEFRRAQEQIKANVLMGMESTVSRMSNMGRNELVLGRDMPPEELVERINAVSKREITDLARGIFDYRQMSFSAVGQVSSDQDYRAALGE